MGKISKKGRQETLLRASTPCRSHTVFGKEECAPTSLPLPHGSACTEQWAQLKEPLSGALEQEPVPPCQIASDMQKSSQHGLEAFKDAARRDVLLI